MTVVERAPALRKTGGHAVDLFDAADRATAEADLNAMCEKLLANTVIESFDVRVEES